MKNRNILILGLVIILMLTGCAKRIPVTYQEVEQTNFVEITLLNGSKIVGSVQKVEPHQIIVLEKDQRMTPVVKTSIRSIKRNPPVYDDFGNGISEDEIASVKTNKNATIYGIGGGALCMGASFFLGSMAANSMDENGGVALAASTAVGGGLGTYLFVKAGKAKDRKDAIEAINMKRKSREITAPKANTELQDLNKQIEEEKEKREKLRKKHEELLKQLEDKNKED